MVTCSTTFFFFFFFLIIYINDVPKISIDNYKIILFVDDTSIIITNPNPTNFQNSVMKIFKDINSWFSTNLLSLNIEKTLHVICN